MPDATYRQAVFADTFLRQSANECLATNARVSDKSKACPAIDAHHGNRGSRPQAWQQPTQSRSCRLSISPEGDRHCRDQPGLEHRHYILSATKWVHVSGSCNRLAQPVCSQLGIVQHARHSFLHRGSRTSFEGWTTNDIQYRSRVSVHKREVHKMPPRSQYSNQHGWQRPGSGQCLCGTPVALGQIRMHISERFRNCSSYQPVEKVLGCIQS